MFVWAVQLLMLGAISAPRCDAAACAGMIIDEAGAPAGGASLGVETHGRFTGGMTENLATWGTARQLMGLS